MHVVRAKKFVPCVGEVRWDKDGRLNFDSLVDTSPTSLSDVVT